MHTLPEGLAWGFGTAGYKWRGRGNESVTLATMDSESTPKVKPHPVILGQHWTLLASVS